MFVCLDKKTGKFHTENSTLGDLQDAVLFTSISNIPEDTISLKVDVVQQIELCKNSDKAVLVTAEGRFCTADPNRQTSNLQEALVWLGKGLPPGYPAVILVPADIVTTRVSLV